jgi:uncharacterized protein YybS (DUF2232 family)
MDKPIRVGEEVLKMLDDIKKHFHCSYSTAILIAMKENNNVEKRIQILESEIESLKKKFSYA